MSRSLTPLVTKLLKVYFSNTTNKEEKYKKIIFYSLKDMGGIYIKFLQILSVTRNFMDGWSTPKEFEVFNQVEEEKIDLYRYLPHKDRFSYIADKPFAGGSFAQIYRGTLKSGEEVVIKILRPSVANNLEKDLKILNKIVNIISFILPKNMIDLKEAFEKFSQNSILETDYEREVANIFYFKNYYKDNSKIIIPNVYKEFCNKRIIVEDYIEGPTLADIVTNLKTGDNIAEIAYKKTNSDIWTQIIIAGGEALKSAMTADFIFGDPHPGNIILLPDNKIAYIDFGLIASKPTSQKAFYLWVKSYYDILNGNPNYGKLIETTCACFCVDIFNALKKCSMQNDFFTAMSKSLNNKANLMRDKVMELDNYLDNGHLFMAFTQFLDNKNALNLKLDMKNYQLLKSLQAFICSISSIDERYGSKQFSKIMKESIKYALDYCEKVGINNDIETKTKYSLSESYELLIENLTILANNDEFLFQDICERMFL